MDIILIQHIVCKALGTGKLFPCPHSAHIPRQNVEEKQKTKPYQLICFQKGKYSEKQS